MLHVCYMLGYIYIVFNINDVNFHEQPVMANITDRRSNFVNVNYGDTQACKLHHSRMVVIYGDITASHDVFLLAHLIQDHNVDCTPEWPLKIFIFSVHFVKHKAQNVVGDTTSEVQPVPIWVSEECVLSYWYSLHQKSTDIVYGERKGNHK